MEDNWTSIKTMLYLGKLLVGSDFNVARLMHGMFEFCMSRYDFLHTYWHEVYVKAFLIIGMCLLFAFFFFLSLLSTA